MTHESDSHRNWKTPSIQTFTGLEFFPLDPKVDQIQPLDIAHALSLKCRYTGHCEFFFSVAQHSCLLSDYVAHLGGSIVDQRWALMHDASEGYLPDVAGPIKRHIPGFVEIEDRLLRAIGDRFELPWPKNPWIADLDRLMYWRERRVLLKDVSWIERQQEKEPVTGEMVDNVPIVHWTPERAKQEFWVRFCYLFNGWLNRNIALDQTRVMEV